MLVALIRAMKPKMLDSFKDYNAQKEFLAKLNNNKRVTVVLNDKKNIVKQVSLESVNKYLNKKGTIIIYNFKRPD